MSDQNTPQPQAQSTPTFRHSDVFNEFAAAMSKAQAEIEGAEKNKSNEFFKSSYADLESVWNACRGPITKNGFAVIQAPQMRGNSVRVTTRIIHTSGQWYECSLDATLQKADAQSIGSAITYLRRYSLSAMIGIPQVEDDDGNGASGRRPSQGNQLQRPPQQRQAPKATQPFENKNTEAPKSPTSPSDAEIKKLKALLVKEQSRNWDVPSFMNYIKTRYGAEDVHSMTFEQVAEVSETITKHSYGVAIAMAEDAAKGRAT